MIYEASGFLIDIILLHACRCGHECCKNGIPVKTSSLSAKQIKSTPKKSTPKFTGASSMKPPVQSVKMTRYVDQLHANFPATPVFKRMTVCTYIVYFIKSLYSQISHIEVTCEIDQ